MVLDYHKLWLTAKAGCDVVEATFAGNVGISIRRTLALSRINTPEASMRAPATACRLAVHESIIVL